MDKTIIIGSIILILFGLLLYALEHFAGVHEAKVFMFPSAIGIALGIFSLIIGLFTKPEDIEKGTKRLHEILPKCVHDRIEPLRQEGDWVDFLKFNPHFLHNHPEYALPEDKI